MDVLVEACSHRVKNGFAAAGLRALFCIFHLRLFQSFPIIYKLDDICNLVLAQVKLDAGGIEPVGEEHAWHNFEPPDVSTSHDHFYPEIPPTTSEKNEEPLWFSEIGKTCFLNGTLIFCLFLSYLFKT